MQKAYGDGGQAIRNVEARHQRCRDREGAPIRQDRAEARAVGPQLDGFGAHVGRRINAVREHWRRTEAFHVRKRAVVSV